ncbi:MAG: hypothetical protein ABR576_01625 [Thermoanaerobaculia bacterium]
MTPPDSSPSPASRRRASRGALVWVLASAALFVGPVARWLDVPAQERLLVPQTPVDRTLGRYAEEWRFLARAREFVPDGASVTVRAESHAREVSLYILSIGLLPEARLVPAAYYDAPAEHPKRRARFVLSLGCHPPYRAGLRTVARLPEGCVFQDSAAR